MSIQLTTLANGLRIVTDIMADVETCAVGIYSGVGTRHEDLSLNGISHFLEHMLFKGTARRTARAIAEEIEDAGGSTNAFTGREMTGYYAHTLKGEEERALDVLADLILNSTFPADELERERTVILQEIAACNDTPDDIVSDYYQATAFPDQPLGASILGPPAIVERLTGDDLRHYLRTHYTPDRLVVSAAGPIDHDRLVQQINTLFSAPKGPELPPAQPANYQGGATHIVRPIEQTQIMLGFPAVPRSHPLEDTARLTAAILGGGASSRLFQEVREKRGLVYSIAAYYTPYQDAGMLSVYAGCAPERVREVIDVVRATLAGVADAPLERELQRAKTQIRAALLMSREQTMTRSEQQARSLLQKNRLFNPAEALARMDAVTTHGIRDFLSTALMGPVTETVYGVSV